MKRPALPMGGRKNCPITSIAGLDEAALTVQKFYSRSLVDAECVEDLHTDTWFLVGCAEASAPARLNTRPRSILLVRLRTRGVLSLRGRRQRHEQRPHLSTAHIIIHRELRQTRGPRDARRHQQSPTSCTPTGSPAAAEHICTPAGKAEHAVNGCSQARRRRPFALV